MVDRVCDAGALRAEPLGHSLYLARSKEETSAGQLQLPTPPVGARPETKRNRFISAACPRKTAGARPRAPRPATPRAASPCRRPVRSSRPGAARPRRAQPAAAAAARRRGAPEGTGLASTRSPYSEKTRVAFTSRRSRGPGGRRASAPPARREVMVASLERVDGGEVARRERRREGEGPGEV